MVKKQRNIEDYYRITGALQNKFNMSVLEFNDKYRHIGYVNNGIIKKVPFKTDLFTEQEADYVLKNVVIEPNCICGHWIINNSVFCTVENNELTYTILGVDCCSYIGIILTSQNARKCIKCDIIISGRFTTGICKDCKPKSSRKSKK